MGNKMPDKEEDLRDSLTRFEDFVADLGDDIEPDATEDEEY